MVDPWPLSPLYLDEILEPVENLPILKILLTVNMLWLYHYNNTILLVPKLDKNDVQFEKKPFKSYLHLTY